MAVEEMISEEPSKATRAIVYLIIGIAFTLPFTVCVMLLPLVETSSAMHSFVFGITLGVIAVLVVQFLSAVAGILLAKSNGTVEVSIER